MPRPDQTTAQFTSLSWLPSVLDLRTIRVGTLPTTRPRPVAELVYADGWAVRRYGLTIADGKRALMVTIQGPGLDEVGALPSGTRPTQSTRYDAQAIEAMNLPVPDITYRSMPGTGGLRLESQHAALSRPHEWLDGLSPEIDPTEYDRALHHLLAWAVEPGLTWPHAKAWMDDAKIYSHMTLMGWRNEGLADEDIPGWAAIESGRAVARYFAGHLPPQQAEPWIEHAYWVHGSFAAALLTHGWTAQEFGAGLAHANVKGLLARLFARVEVSDFTDSHWEQHLLTMAAAGIGPTLAWAAFEAGLSGTEAVSLHQHGALDLDDLHLMAGLRTVNA